MPRIKYKDIKFKPDTLLVISRAISIISEYSRKGFDLTLRQLFYQFVSKGLIANTQNEYKKLGSIINDARLAGMIDWNHITDRTRELHRLPAWENPQGILEAVAQQYRIDKWENQPFRVEVFIEKDALKGVFTRVCNSLQVPLFSCRGYTSQSEMWVAGQRMKGHIDNGQTPVILHFGDHDPSGIDMSRDITDRLEMFMGGVNFQRLALNMEQVEEFSPPPNPAKITDSRARAYIMEYGDESWELDALSPEVLAGLVESAVLEHRDEDLWAEKQEEEDEAKKIIQKLSDYWYTVSEYVETEFPDEEEDEDDEDDDDDDD